MANKECPVCHKYFESCSSAKRIYCSQACFKKSRVKPPIIKKCVICEKDFNVSLRYSQKDRDRAKTCSRECGLKYIHQLNVGRPCSEEKKRKIGEKNKYTKKLRGKNHPRWKTGSGARKRESHRVRTSLGYKEWRVGVFKRDNYTCQVCGRTGGDLRAHHIKKFIDHKDERLDKRNGITVCSKCHYKINKKESDWEIFFYENLIRRGVIKKPFGWQILVDAYRCKHETMDDVNLVYEFLEAAVAVLGVQKQHPPFVFHSPSGYPDKAGISSFCCIIESGISVHTLSCKDFASIDYYSCSAMSQETETRLIGIVNEYFHPEEIKRQFVLRGTEYNEEG